MWDYLRRSRTQGYFVPLSGGIDSCSTAVITYSMCVQVAKAAQEGSEYGPCAGDKIGVSMAFDAAHHPFTILPRLEQTSKSSRTLDVSQENRRTRRMFQRIPKSSAIESSILATWAPRTRASKRGRGRRISRSPLEREWGLCDHPNGCGSRLTPELMWSMIFQLPYRVSPSLIASLQLPLH